MRCVIGLGTSSSSSSFDPSVRSFDVPKQNDVMDDLLNEWASPVVNRRKNATTIRGSGHEYGARRLPKLENRNKMSADPLIDLVCACFAVIEVLGTGIMDIAMAGPKHVFDVYSGNVPISTETAFLTDDPELLSLVVQAYRYAFKLTFDQAVIGEIESDSEILEQMEVYSKNWFFGLDTTNEWNDNIICETPNLFSMAMKEGVYTAHILSLRPQLISVCKMNDQAVKGLWASLNQELLYFANDDEERYSIQGHTNIMRNLTVQAAEPPLGYPVFSNVFEITCT
eukprot:TRINITY_DN12171_c0_g1_i1.p1 TRINITY_DN12171_c0_g1~~TRINITY_DN12171_c0_g1_i1.p1  ORF type:complete len:283 (+),score=53.16 TRINITY_DN12171_c0_g1_i1:97-945(+)